MNGNQDPPETELGNDLNNFRNNEDVRVISEEEKNFIVKRYNKLCKWERLLAVMVVTGMGRFSTGQYETVWGCISWRLQGILRDKSRITQLPHYSTIARTLLPNLHSLSFVEEAVTVSEIALSKSGARARTKCRKGQRIVTTESAYKVVLPNSWTKIDISRNHTLEMLKYAAALPFREGDRPLFATIKETPMVRCKETILQVDNYVMPQTNGAMPNQNGCTILRTVRGHSQEFLCQY